MDRSRFTRSNLPAGGGGGGRGGAAGGRRRRPHRRRSTNAPAACRNSTATSRSTGTSAPARCSSRSRASTPISCYTPASPPASGSNDIGLDRGAGGGGRLVSFQRVGPRVLLVQPNKSFRSSSANPLERKSVEDSFAKSVLWGFTVAAESERPRARRRHRLPAARRHRRRQRAAPGHLPRRSHAQRVLHAAHEGVPEEHRNRDDADLRQRRRRRTRRRRRRAAAGPRTDSRKRRRPRAAAAADAAADSSRARSRASRRPPTR